MLSLRVLRLLDKSLIVFVCSFAKQSIFSTIFFFNCNSSSANAINCVSAETFFFIFCCLYEFKVESSWVCLFRTISVSLVLLDDCCWSFACSSTVSSSLSLSLSCSSSSSWRISTSSCGSCGAVFISDVSIPPSICSVAELPPQIFWQSSK